MSPMAVCSCPPAFARLTVLLTIAWFILVVVKRRTISAALVPAALNAASAWVLVARVIEGESLSGGGRGARAAGLAEMQAYLLFGLIVGIITIVLFLAIAWSLRSEETVWRHRSTIVVCGVGILLGVAGTLHINGVTYNGALTIATGMLAITIVLVVISFLRGPQPPAYRALAIALIAHIAAASALWFLMQRLMSIARGD